ncbi:hypothetical protein RJ641_017584 [Dillenia turbinata]|uniref:Uncharacterized protein n=1 Tax=Dillenia turbinata TaxID=194707 RepID=A0AAN8UYD8_9MAGN
MVGPKEIVKAATILKYKKHKKKSVFIFLYHHYSLCSYCGIIAKEYYNIVELGVAIGMAGIVLTEAQQKEMEVVKGVEAEAEAEEREIEHIEMVEGISKEMGIKLKVKAKVEINSLTNLR